MEQPALLTVGYRETGIFRSKFIQKVYLPTRTYFPVAASHSELKPTQIFTFFTCFT